jgi:hypothetical protein
MRLDGQELTRVTEAIELARTGRASQKSGSLRERRKKLRRLAGFSAPGLVIFPNTLMLHIAVQGFLRGTRIALD